MAKKKKVKRTKGVSEHDLKGELRATANMISTKCTNCNLRLVIPEVESHRCILCGCKELTKNAWSRN